MSKPLIVQRHWSSKALFNQLAGSGWVNPGIDQKYKAFFLADLESEYDAVNLYCHLYPRRRQLSPLAVRYLDVWFSDERNHADGFLELNRLLFALDEQEIMDVLRSRTSDFGQLEELLSCEFKLLLMFAYDEYVSVKTYRKDTFYNEFGHPGFNVWIKNLIADETVHFANAIRILKVVHASSLCNAEQVLRSIVEMEGTAYRNTFLMDHDGPHFLLENSELGNTAVDEILAILARGHR